MGQDKDEVGKSRMGDRIGGHSEKSRLRILKGLTQDTFTSCGVISQEGKLLHISSASRRLWFVAGRRS